MATSFNAYDSTHRAAIKATFGNRRNWQRFCEIEHRLSFNLHLKTL